MVYRKEASLENKKIKKITNFHFIWVSRRKQVVQGLYTALHYVMSLHYVSTRYPTQTKSKNGKKVSLKSNRFQNAECINFNVSRFISKYIRNGYRYWYKIKRL